MQDEGVPPNARSDPKTPEARKTKPIFGRTPEAIAKAIPETALKGLTPKRQMFVREYFVDLNATQAAIRAGYSPNSASEIGYENLRKPQIAAAIDSAFMELGGITRSRIVDELGAIAFANIGQVLTWGDEIQEISEGDTYFINGKEHLAKDCITRVIRQRVRVLPIATMDTSVSRVISEVSQTAKGSVKVKMHDKLAALDKLARALGMYQPIEDAGNNARSMVAVNIYEGRPASRARRDEPAFGLVGHDRDESD
jgi:phage terminase small subunit